jgi:hypothetical protein
MLDEGVRRPLLLLGGISLCKTDDFPKMLRSEEAALGAASTLIIS